MKRQSFRKFFRVDPAETCTPARRDPDINPNNEDTFQRAKTWFQRSNDLIDRAGEQHRMDTVLCSPTCLPLDLDYAQARKDEGLLDAETTAAWQQFYARSGPKSTARRSSRAPADSFTSKP